MAGRAHTALNTPPGLTTGDGGHEVTMSFWPKTPTLFVAAGDLAARKINICGGKNDPVPNSEKVLVCR
jgi:hypothetical protein